MVHPIFFITKQPPMTLGLDKLQVDIENNTVCSNDNLEYRDHTCFFHALTFDPRMLFEHEANKPSVQHHPRDPASLNAMKQTCVIVILAYCTLFRPNPHCKRCLTSNCHFSYTGFLLTKWRRLCTFERHNVVTSSQLANKKICEMISLVRNALRI